MNIIYQSYPPIGLKVNIRIMMETKPIAIYHQGTTTDNLCESGDFKKLHDNLKLIRDTGLPIGFATHDPETILLSEKEGWDVDFYMACLYNARRDNRGEESGFITGKSKHLEFYPNDRFVMYDVIKRVKKPIIAFKIFAGGQIFCDKTTDEIPKVIHSAFKEAYDNIKPFDITCIGVFQKYKNQIKENTDIVKSILKTH